VTVVDCESAICFKDDPTGHRRPKTRGARNSMAP
jgi:hypothetical protein